MGEPAPRRKSFGLLMEQYGPLAISTLCAIAIFLFRVQIVDQFKASGGWDVNNLYAAVFNWSAIQIGFAFGVYGFVVGKNDGFVQEIRERLAMQRFLGYVRRANIGGFVLSITSLPLTIASPRIADSDSTFFIGLIVWFSLFIWTFLAFLRVAYGFGHLSSVQDQPEFHGA